MARIINTPLCLGVIAAAHPKLDLKIKVTDHLLTYNSHTYIIKDGLCTIDDTFSHRLDFDIDADTLNKMVFSSAKIGDILDFPSERPYMTLMLD